ncbi:MAG TPA: GNAT family N-acetyltransferase [Polyangia bacterium]|nr:GNAT family N-acetyltransferase [Polyangia bacterium]
MPAPRRERARFTIRRAAQGDTGGVLDCLRAAFAPYRDRYTAAAFRDTVLTPETLRERLATMSVFVAVSRAGAILGTIACVVVGEREGHLRGMAVRPRWQGRGLARALLEAAQTELRERSCTRISLDTTEPLARAVRFYRGQGFRASGTVRDYFGMPLLEYVKELA